MSPDPTDALGRVLKDRDLARIERRAHGYPYNRNFTNAEIKDLREALAELRRWRAGSGEGRLAESLRERILDIALRNRDACGYNCDCHDEIAALFASLPAPPRTQP